MPPNSGCRPGCAVPSGLLPSWRPCRGWSNNSGCIRSARRAAAPTGPSATPPARPPSCWGGRSAPAAAPSARWTRARPRPRSTPLRRSGWPRRWPASSSPMWCSRPWPVTIWPTTAPACSQPPWPPFAAAARGRRSRCSLPTSGAAIATKRTAWRPNGSGWPPCWPPNRCALTTTWKPLNACRGRCAAAPPTAAPWPCWPQPASWHPRSPPRVA